MKIQISEVKIEFIRPCDGLVAFASVVINDAICLSSIAIHRKPGTNDYRITYPNKGSFSIFYPINRTTSKQIEEEIFNKLNEVMSKVYGKNDYTHN